MAQYQPKAVRQCAPQEESSKTRTPSLPPHSQSLGLTHTSQKILSRTKLQNRATVTPYGKNREKQAELRHARTSHMRDNGSADMAHTTASRDGRHATPARHAALAHAARHACTRAHEWWGTGECGRPCKLPSCRPQVSRTSRASKTPKTPTASVAPALALRAASFCRSPWRPRS